MELESTVKLIGCLVLVVFIFAIPCLTTLAWVLNWNAFLKYLFTLFSISAIFTAAAALFNSVD